MTRRRRSPPGNPARAVAYLRASTDRQDLSPGAQRAAIERWAAGAGVVVVAWHEDLGVSGGTALDDRPGLLAALDCLDAAGAGTLVVAKRDRLARDVLTAALVERLCERKGARVVAADGVANGDGPEAALMRSLLDAFAQYERALIRARTRAALAVKKARGERTGGVPLGSSVGADGRLSADPAEAAAVARERAPWCRAIALGARHRARRREAPTARKRSHVQAPGRVLSTICANHVPVARWPPALSPPRDSLGAADARWPNPSPHSAPQHGRPPAHPCRGLPGRTPRAASPLGVLGAPTLLPAC